MTTPRDPAARLTHYTGNNQDREEHPSRARNVYGYRSYPQVLCNDELYVSWVAYTSLHLANSDERAIMPNDFAYLRHRLPDLQIGEFVANAAVGCPSCLNSLYDDGVIPVIVIRHDKGDKDQDTCKVRGYDKNGHPLSFGFSAPFSCWQNHVRVEPADLLHPQPRFAAPCKP